MHFLLSRFSGVALATVPIGWPDINGVLCSILSSQNLEMGFTRSNRTNVQAPDSSRRLLEDSIGVEVAESSVRPSLFLRCDGRNIPDSAYPWRDIVLFGG